MLPDSSYPARIEERQRNKIIVKHLILRPHLLSAIGRRVLASDFLAEDGDLHFLLNAVHMYFMEFNGIPPLDVLCRELNDQWIEMTPVGGQPPFPEEYLASYRRELTEWYKETQWADAWCQQWLLDHLQRFEAQKLSRSMQSTDDLDEIKNAWEEAEDILRGDPFVNLHEQTAWDNIWDAMHEEERMKLGLQFMDNALDGGAAPKECILLVAPSGGGKTTIGMQLSAYRVARHSHVVYLSTEQALEGDMAMRQAMLGAQAPRSVLKKGRHAAPPDVLERLEVAKNEWKTYFHFVDCRKKAGGPNMRIEDLFAPIDRLLAMGQQIDLVVLDWWGRLRSRMLMQMQRSSDARDRNAASDWLDTLIQGIKDRNSRLLVLHQVKGAKAGMGANAKVTTHDAQEDSNLNNLFEFGFAVGKLDSDNRTKINCDKARSSARTSGELELDGDRGMFKTVEPTTSTGFSDLGNVPRRTNDMVNDDALGGVQI